MNNFDAKWQMCAERARQTDAREDSAPFGFAARVAALGMEASQSPPSVELLWQRLAARCFGFLAVLLIVCAVIELPHLGDRKPLEPGIENTVAQVIWAL